jgi:hypothetical protein
VLHKKRSCYPLFHLCVAGDLEGTSDSGDQFTKVAFIGMNLNSNCLSINVESDNMYNNFGKSFLILMDSSIYFDLYQVNSTVVLFANVL